MSTYGSFRKRISPPWLRGTVADAWHDGHGALEDAIGNNAKAAVKAPWPSYGPSDALPLIAADTQLEQGPSESEASFRARLLAAPDAWTWAGTDRGILQYALSPAGYTNARIIANRDWVGLGGVPPDGDTAKWARFWLVIGTPHGFTFNALWGAESHVWGSDAHTWGSSASLNDYARIRRLVLQWKASHATAVGAWIVNGASTTIDTVPGTTWNESDATFGGASALFWRFH